MCSSLDYWKYYNKDHVRFFIAFIKVFYIEQFELYQGVQGRQTQYEGLGMGGSVVMNLISELHEEVGNSFHMTFGNLVTSLKLVDCLTAKQIACTYIYIYMHVCMYVCTLLLLPIIMLLLIFHVVFFNTFCSFF